MPRRPIKNRHGAAPRARGRQGWRSSGCAWTCARQLYAARLYPAAGRQQGGRAARAAA
eukprot:SAG25_NODE_2665_length_1459_cov_5.961029_2_plen_57_part_01